MHMGRENNFSIDTDHMQDAKDESWHAATPGQRAWFASGCTTLLITLAKSIVMIAGAPNRLRTLVETTLAGFVGYILADLVSGIYHWGLDNYGSVNTPILGPIIKEFLARHHQPLEITKCEVASIVYGFAGLVTVTIMPVNVLSNDPVVDAGIILRWSKHVAHHRPPYHTNYCSVSGVWNRVLDKFKFFVALEVVLFKMLGVRAIDSFIPQHSNENNEVVNMNQAINMPRTCSPALSSTRDRFVYDVGRDNLFDITMDDQSGENNNAKRVISNSSNNDAEGEVPDIVSEGDSDLNTEKILKEVILARCGLSPVPVGASDTIVPLAMDSYEAKVLALARTAKGKSSKGKNKARDSNAEHGTPRIDSVLPPRAPISEATEVNPSSSRNIFAANLINLDSADGSGGTALESDNSTRTRPRITFKRCTTQDDKKKKAKAEMLKHKNVAIQARKQRDEYLKERDVASNSKSSDKVHFDHLLHETNQKLKELENQLSVSQNKTEEAFDARRQAGKTEFVTSVEFKDMMVEQHFGNAKAFRGSTSFEKLMLPKSLDDMMVGFNKTIDYLIKEGHLSVNFDVKAFEEFAYKPSLCPANLKGRALETFIDYPEFYKLANVDEEDDADAEDNDDLEK
ncbi:hypothetical protein BUALT_Bualt07G0109600 [Buddleja alternifolia]|uniref:Lipid desaturase domain-containing protein n=1 Tax=Buddleja alternifolia TaxID=168488 RepID=A0AAV6XGJ1_9LAMI|nr:hypothetical protein BUALT_Bualt07G0109600 [Buddleja alternifolia]